MANLVGQYLGRYHILEQLGEGGMAVVYKAYDTRLEREVAIKIIRRGAFPNEMMEEVLKRFEREAKSLARLSHPNIVKVHDYGESEGSPYLVLEYLPGGTLKKLLGKPMPWREAARLLLPVARGLAYAHQHGILHRDIKPANILITENGDPMLSDFGIAKILEGEQTTSLTSSSMAVGTPEYMAPEQWSGKTSPQSDLYSLAIVFYEMITGRKPYAADTPAAILIKQATEALPRPSQFAADIPEPIEFLLLKALEKDVEYRFPDMNSFIEALESFKVEETASSRQAPTSMQQPPKAEAERPSQPAIPKAQTPVSNPRLQTRTSQTGNVPKSKPRYGWAIALVMVIAVCGLGTLVAMIGGWAMFATPVSTAAMTATSAPIDTRPAPTETPAAVVVAAPPSNPGELTDEKGVVMRLIPGGDFTMGDDKGEWNEKPAHTFTLSTYYLDQYEVTNKLYRNCVQAGACQPPQKISSFTHNDYFSNPLYDNYPVIWVDWTMAKTYCEWRGARLPTEAEWEKAARGGTARLYPWGDRIDQTLANYGQNVGDTTEVGSYESGKSVDGLYDMLGNVWEWTSSMNMDYPYVPTDGRENLSVSSVRILRGGGWDSDSSYLHTTYRDPYAQTGADLDIGFRCARNANP